MAAATLALYTNSMAAINIVTQHADNGRTGLNSSETILTPANVNQSTFGKLFEKGVDGDMYGQPLYVGALGIGGGVHNVVFVSTANNSIYAFDADYGSAGAYWNRNLGTPVPQGDVDCCCPDIATVIGIIGTGVIDLSTKTWYFVHKQKNSDSTYHQYLHAVDITTGAEKFSGPKEISASASGVAFDAKLNNQRCGLLEQGGNIYIGWSSHNDCGGYHGWVMGYNASTLAQVGAFPVTTSSGSKGGVWMSGGGLVGDGSSIYFMTGNGTFDANGGGSNVGESFVKLSSTLARQDYFTPFNQASLNSADRDLGGGGIVLIPGANRLVGGGKEGKWYLVNSGSMGGYNASADACLQSFQVTDTSDSLNHLHGTPCYFNGNLYVGGESDQLKAFSWNGTSIGTTPSSQSSFEGVSASMPGWQQSISSNGTSNGIVWASRVYSGNANNATQPGILHAFSASNLGTELWNSKQNATRDDLGNFAKNPAPVVANGRVYCPTFSNKLVVYGILGGPIASGEYRLTCETGGCALDNAGSTANGSDVTQWTSGGGNVNQQWVVTNLGNGYYKLVCVKSGKALDNGGVTTLSAPMTQYTDLGNNNQQWSITSVGSGKYELVCRTSNMALDNTGSTANGVVMTQYTTSASNPHQHWSFGAP